jgi:hypothetical protein
MRDIHNKLSVADSVLALNRTADVNGTGVNLQGFEAAEVLFVFGGSGDTLSGTVKVEGKLEESDDDSTYTAVAAADILGTLPVVDDAAEDDKTYAVGYRGTKKFIRAVFDFTGTHTNGIETAAVVVRGHKRHQGAEAV